MLRFTIREALFATVIVAVLCAWWIDRWQQSMHAARLQWELDAVVLMVQQRGWVVETHPRKCF